jgi:hypothetical protein
MSDPRPDPEPVVTFFGLLGVPRLAELIAAGDLGDLTDTETANYAKVAAVAWAGPPIPFHGGDARDELKAHYAYLLIQVMCDDSPDCYRHGDHVYLRTPAGPREVTESMLCHFQRMLALLSDEATARAFLALVPAGLRYQAEEAAAESWDAEFDEITRRW